MALIVFAHANSFPASTYRVLFDGLRQRGYTIEAVDRFGHDERYPVTNNWPHLVEQLADFARAQIARHGERAYLVGHSLGGYLSTLAAAQHPELARGLLLLDSPLLGGWRAASVGVAKRTPLIERVSPGHTSRRRRTTWASKQEALAHFGSKKIFARWHPQVLRDYVEHGLRPSPEGSTLVFEREVETAIYNTIANNIPSVLRKHPLQVPAAFIGGRYSRESRQVGLETTERVTQGRMMMLDGTHLFPMEMPEVATAAIDAALLNIDYASHHARPDTGAGGHHRSSSNAVGANSLKTSKTPEHGKP